MANERGHSQGSVVPEENGGWPSKGTYIESFSMDEPAWANLYSVVAPSEISFKAGDYPDPIEASIEYLESLKKAYADAVERCSKIGFDFIEIHGAHGMSYSFHFFFPLSSRGSHVLIIIAQVTSFTSLLTLFPTSELTNTVALLRTVSDCPWRSHKLSERNGTSPCSTGLVPPTGSRSPSVRKRTPMANGPGGMFYFSLIP